MIVVLFGTRPEAIKLGPIVAELRTLQIPVKVICTGQHTQLLAGTPAETDLADCVSLDLASSGNVPRWLEDAAGPIKAELGTARDAIAVVQGDTMSALAGARAARSLGMTVAHVEAGIRSHRADEPWPEEGFRVEIDHLADWFYAPTSTAYANLLKEGRRLERIRVTGNPVVSAICRYTDAQVVAAPERRVFVTLHRREWLNGPHFEDTIAALSREAQEHADVKFVWPIHPAVRARAGAVSGVRTVPPMLYRDTLLMLCRSMGVITDSGGLQEEAATLGVPCAVLRNVTDRPESLEAGVAQLFPPDSFGVRAAVELVLNDGLPRQATSIYGSALAASTIAQHLGSLLD